MKIHVTTNGGIILRVEFPQMASIAIAKPAVDVHEINRLADVAGIFVLAAKFEGTQDTQIKHQFGIFIS